MSDTKLTTTNYDSNAVPVLECKGCLANPDTSGTNSPFGYAELVTESTVTAIQRLHEDEAWNAGWEDGVEGYYGAPLDGQADALAGKDSAYAAVYLFMLIVGSFAARHNWTTPWCHDHSESYPEQGHEWSDETATNSPDNTHTAPTKS